MAKNIYKQEDLMKEDRILFREYWLINNVNLIATKFFFLLILLAHLLNYIDEFSTNTEKE